MSATCARCGLHLTNEKWTECGDEDTQHSESGYTLDCRDRQIAAQASLLRSVTVKLEVAAELLDNETLTALPEVARAVALIDSVLEILS